ncbi:MAG: carboxypeptidase-like regulatory domain-containing protein [Flavobacteriales bacterium]|nr:carboxypeptidase-like regulatory domain-containing protein [Flavobacteriales bacterium]
MVAAQGGTIQGKVLDATTGEPIIMGNVVIQGTTTGVTTDFDGVFEIKVNSFPVTLEFTYISYQKATRSFNQSASNIYIRLEADQVLLSEAEIVGERISEKQKQSALTMETMDVLAIKEAPSGNFYEGLGNLKDVDLTSASLGFKIINTRGFNSTSPVRSLQLIDGVDNQSPGLNFSLGNFLGASDLDVMKVEVIAGASSAFYGPGAFNGVVNMTTKDPFTFPGFSMYMKKGERGLWEYAIRVAEVVKNQKGEDKFGYKINWFSMNAREWEAENYEPIYNSPHDQRNPYGFDAVNIYGDEPIEPTNDAFDSPEDYVGLGVFYRNGYKERDLVNYNTNNRKFNTGLYYNISPRIRANYNFSYSTGSTIYQGDNRYALRGVEFFQHKLEIGEPDNWFVRAYMTKEDAGDTYDIVTTAVRLQDASGSTKDWNTRLLNTWGANFSDEVAALPRYQEIIDEVINSGLTTEEKEALFRELLAEWYMSDYDYFSNLYGQAVDMVNEQNTLFIDPFYEPGTERFDDKFHEITTKKFTEGGSKFFDRSALYHLQGEKRVNGERVEVVVGANGRFYRPDTEGTIFRDTLQYTYALDDQGGYVLDDQGRRVVLDSAKTQIMNYEWGVYQGVTIKFFEDRLKVSGTWRFDKNQNFKFLNSPALSVVYTTENDHVLRATFSSAVRNPTMADQYLYYNLGRVTLLGNVDGQFEAGNDSLFTIESFTDYRNATNQLVGLQSLEYFNVDRIRPEKAKTFELGYRGTLFEAVYVDLGGYVSRYEDFIGYLIGLNANFNQQNGLPVGGIRAYRVAANASSIVWTNGFSIGLNYYFKKFNLSGNYSYNNLVSGADDPIIPAFNTPRNKFNLGLSARDMTLFSKIHHVGFGINYKWIQGFIFEGSPQFTGPIDTYDMLDAQVSVDIPKMNCTVKLGGSNIFGIIPFFDNAYPNFSDKFERATHNMNLQVYGGPRVGRLLYASVQFDIK